MMANDYAYPGQELELFFNAINWKRYFSSLLKLYITGDVLEVGAGMAANTPYLLNDSVSSWSLLEPDTGLYHILNNKISDGQLPPICRCLKGTLSTHPGQPAFDCILYIDVLEHIEQDRLELELASIRLKPGGKLIVLSPAYQSLMSPFDRSVGHYRRYNRKSLEKIAPASLVRKKICYADSMGLFASIANRWFLKQTLPTMGQLAFWDKKLIPLSRISDRIIMHQAGKSIIAVWEKPLT